MRKTSLSFSVLMESPAMDDFLVVAKDPSTTTLSGARQSDRRATAGSTPARIRPSTSWVVSRTRSELSMCTFTLGKPLRPS